MNKGKVIALVAVLLVVGLFMWGKKTQQDNIVYFGDTNIACLTHGHQTVAEHIHPIMKITVDGEPEQIPANIGITSTCMSELHTHDATGTIHAESFLTDRISEFNLSDFFSVWGQSHVRDGYDVEIMQDGVVKNSIEDVKFIDHSVIELNYISKSSEM